MSRRFTLIFALSCLVFTGLACSLSGPETAPATVEPTLSPPVAAPPTTQPAAVSPTKVQIEVPTAMPTIAGEVLPTDTLTPTPTSTSTGTPTLTATLTNTLKPKPATATPTKKPVSTGPLTINYEFVIVKRNPNNQAVLTIKVIATGGGGGYTYYHDDQKQAGATFDVSGSCGHPFVHTLKVTSADGQTASVGYFKAGDCPTPTSTPKP